jgi:outer membrane receptor protein involved in Fe transport
MRSRLLVSTALALVAFSPVAALAQDTPPPPPAEGEQSSGPIEKVTVTAQKRKQRLQDVPISIKSLDGEELDKVNADGLEDVTRMVPSLTMTNISRGGNQVQIRGLGSNVGSVGTVAIYNDGVIASSRIQSSGTFAEQDSALYDIDRIEILRGPQGTLYGEGSFGGVINIISKAPNSHAMEASFSGSWFDVEEGSSENYDLNAMVNLPIVKDLLAVRAVGYSYDHDGYIDAVDIGPAILEVFAPGFGGPAELVAEDANTEEIQGGRVIVAFTPSDTFDAKFTYKTENTKLGINSTASPHQIEFANSLFGTSFNPALSQSIFGPAIGGDTLFGSEKTVDEGILEMNLDLGIGTLTSITGYGTTNIENANTALFDGKAWSEELRLGSDSDGPFNWITGFYYRDAERDISFQGAPFAQDELTQWAIFGQAYWEFVPSWTLTAGLRYEEQEIAVTDEINALPTVNGEFSSVIPKLALDWKSDEDTLWYASVAKGFRAGGANVDTSLGTDPTYEAAFDPDQIWNYELGVKAGLFGGIVTFNSALFYIDWSDIQIDKAIVSVVTPPVQFITVNGEGAHAYGIEADIYVRPTDDLDITFGGSLVNAEFEGGVIIDEPGFPVSIDGMRLPSSPKYLFNASIEQRFPLATELEGYIRGDMSIRGSSFGDVPNTPPVGLLGPGDFTSGQSTFVNLRAGVRGEVWELQAFVTNAFDERASTFTFYDGGFAEVGSVLRPRTIGLNLKLRYSDEEK